MNINDIEIERAVLGEFLAFDALFEKAVLLEVDDFVYEEHRVICRSILKFAKIGKKFVKSISG